RHATGRAGSCPAAPGRRAAGGTAARDPARSWIALRCGIAATSERRGHQRQDPQRRGELPTRVCAVALAVRTRRTHELNLPVRWMTVETVRRRQPGAPREIALKNQDEN